MSLSDAGNAPEPWWKSDLRQLDTFDGALRVQRLPFEHHAAIHRVDHIPVERFEASGLCVRAIRRDGGHVRADTPSGCRRTEKESPSGGAG
jgi:hypothetical protein